MQIRLGGNALTGVVGALKFSSALDHRRASPLNIRAEFIPRRPGVVVRRARTGLEYRMGRQQSDLPAAGRLDRPARVAWTRPLFLRAAQAISSFVRPKRRASANVREDDVRRQRICLFGLFGGGNYGNDGSLEAMLLVLRQARPEAELSCVCVDPNLIGTRHQIPAIAVSWPGFSNPAFRLFNKIALKAPARLANWVRAIQHVRQFDMMIVPGTSTLCDYRSGPFGTPYGIFRWAAAARLCGVKLCFVSTGAGPISHPLSRWMLKRVAGSAHYRSFRDQVSKDFVTSLGVDAGKDLVCPDLVFKLPTPELAGERAAAGRPLTFGVGVMDYTGWERIHDASIYEAYLAKMDGYVASLLDRGYRVRLLVGENLDQRMVDDLANSLAKKGRRLMTPAPLVAEPSQLIAEPIHSLHDLMRQIADTDIVVATRFHNVVCALKLARPTISIGYEAKNEAVMADFGFGDFCQHVEQLDVVRLNDQTTELLNRRSFYEQQIRRRLEDIQRRMAQQEELLKSSIL